MLLDQVLSEISAYSVLELAAVLLAVTYLLLAARNNRFCWIAAFFSSIIFVAVLWQANLFMDTLLNAYYIIMAVYGWLCWSAVKSPEGRASNVEETSANQIANKPAQFHLLSILLIILLSLVSGYLLGRYTEAAYPYLDSLTTWSALFATWLLAQRILENWLYWLAIDTLSIYLYYQKGLHFTVILFVIYVIVAAYAYLHWRSLEHARQ